MKPNDILIKHQKAIKKLPAFVQETYADIFKLSVNGILYKGKDENNKEFYLNIRAEINKLLKWGCKTKTFTIADQDVFIIVKGSSYE